MALPSSLLKDFAKITNDRETSRKSINAYGITIKTGENVYVKLDGTEELTPVSVSMDAEDGDRVLVSIEKHTATVIGNITCPASARTATNYMKLTEDGLVVGQLDKSGRPVGTYSLIAPGTYYIMAENGATLASFSSNEIKLGGGMAVFSTDKITLGNGMATFTTTEIKLGNGMAVFTTDKITLGNGMAVFSTSGINLGDGKLKIEPNKITLGTKGEAVFTPEKVTLAGGAASFSADEISLAGGMAVINPTKVSIGNGTAVFTTDKITLGDGMAVISLSEISLANGKAVFREDSISLAGGMAVFTGDSISLGTGMAVISTSKISLAGGKAEFTESQISLMEGQAVIQPTQITLGGDMAKITTNQISLANGKAVFSAEYISLDGDSVRIDKSGIKLGNTTASVINLCNGSGSILVNNGVMVLKGTTAAGLLASYSNYRSEVVAKCDSGGNRTAAMQVYNADNTSEAASIIVDLSKGITMNTLNGKEITINGHEILNNYNLMTDGRIRATGSVDPGKRVNLKTRVTVPSGYHLAGIRQITTSNPGKCCVTSFLTNPSTGEIGVSLYNMSNDTLSGLAVTIEWFAFRFLGTVNTEESVIPWGAESVE